MIGKLCQVIAVTSGKKSHTEKALTELHRITSKPELTTGHVKVYAPKEDGGDAQPSENQKVQVKVLEAVIDAKKLFADLWKSVATLDIGNRKAKADIVLPDGTVLAKDVPVTHMLFLEHQLQDVEKFVSSLVVLDPAQNWTYDANLDHYKSEPSQSTKTKKTIVPILMSPATDKFPAQVKESSEEVVVGTYTQTKFSSGVPAKTKREAVERIRLLKDAVKAARELANGQEVEDIELDGPLLDYIFNGLVKAA